MAVKDLRALAATNLQLLNLVRTDASTAYQQRIPAATQGNIADTIGALGRHETHRNEFVNALINKVGLTVFRQNSWQNPLSEFKMGQLEFGETVEDVFANITKAQRFDKQSEYEDVFAQDRPEVLAHYHQVNRQDFYEVTVSEDQLNSAFNSETGLMGMLELIMSTPNTSDSFDEYLLMRNLFAEMARLDGYYKVQIPDPQDPANVAYPARKDVALTIAEKIRIESLKLGFMTSLYNVAGVTTATKIEDMCLFVTPELEALNTVNVLRDAFQRDGALPPSRVVVVDDFGIKGCHAILADKKFFVVLDKLFKMKSIENPKALSWNYFLHHWQVLSVCRFANAIMFTTLPGTSKPIPDVTLASVAVKLGADKRGIAYTYASPGLATPLLATVNGTINPDDPHYIVPQSVVWEITASDVPLSEGTYINADGYLNVDHDEKATQVTVKATTTFMRNDVEASAQVQYSATLVVGIGAVVTP
jgi:hypothetical protein